MATRIELSTFTYVDRPKRFGGKALRFTWSLHVDIKNGESIEISIEGCLAYIRDIGDLVWSPPISRWGIQATRQMHWINPYTYQLTLKCLLENPNLLKPIQDCFNEVLELRQAREIGRQASTYDPTLPKIIRTVLEVKEKTKREVASKPTKKWGSKYLP